MPGGEGEDIERQENISVTRVLCLTFFNSQPFASGILSARPIATIIIQYYSKHVKV